MQAAKRDPRAAEAAPRVSPCKGAPVRRTHTAPTPVRSSPRVPSQKTHARTHRDTAPRARAHTPLGPAARTYPATRRAHQGPRTAAASCQTSSRPRRPDAGGRRGTQFTTPGQGGWRRPQAMPPLDRRSAAEGRRGPGGSLTTSNGARDPCPRSSHTPRRSRASRGGSVVSGPPR